MNLPAEHAPTKNHAQAAISRSRSRQAVVFVILIGLVAAAGFGFRGFRKKKLASPVVSYASAVSTAPGLVAEILVHPGQRVRKGELLAVMDFGELEAQREEAQQEVLEAVAASASGDQAIATPTFPPGMAGGFEKKAVPVGKLPPPLPQVQTNGASVVTAKPQGGTAATASSGQTPNVPAQMSPDSKVKELAAKIKSESDAVKSLQESFSQEQDAATSAQNLVNSLTIAEARTKADSDKSQTLLAEGVISANDAAKAQSYDQQAQGQLEDAKVHAAASEAGLGDTHREIDKTTLQIATDTADLKKAQAAATEAKKHPVILNTKPDLKSPPVQVPQYKLVPVPAPGPVAPPTPMHVDFLPPALAGQRINMAEAKLDAIGQRFTGACIYAPSDGVIMRVAIKPGQTIQANTVAVVIRRN